MRGRALWHCPGDRSTPTNPRKRQTWLADPDGFPPYVSPAIAAESSLEEPQGKRGLSNGNGTMETLGASRGDNPSMPRRSIDRTRLRIESLEDRATPTAALWMSQTFGGGNATLPADWARWPTTATLSIKPGMGVASSSGPVVPGGANAARAWEKSIVPADSEAEAKYRADGVVPLQLILRGRNLNSARPTFYAATVGSGGTIQISRTINGISTVLASVKAATWPTGKWFDVDFQPMGNQFALIIHCLDNGNWLDATGRWVPHSTVAIAVHDDAIAGAGQAGFNRPAGRTGRLQVDDFVIRLPKAIADGTFDGQSVGAQPAGWDDLSSSSNSTIRIGAAGAAGNGLSSIGSSADANRLWMSAPLPSDVTATAAIFANSLISAQVIARGQNLIGLQPTYYAASVVRGTQVKLLRVVNGIATELGTLQSATYVSEIWLDVSLTTQGNHIQARVQRRDAGDWLNRFGGWQAETATAIDVTDSVIQGTGYVGLVRPASYSGTVAFDDFRVSHAGGDITAPNLSTRIQPLVTAFAGSIRGKARLVASATDAGGIARVEFFVDGALLAQRTARPYQFDYDSRNLSNGAHTLSIRAWDAAGNVAVRERTFATNNPPGARPIVPSHMSHIRIAALAYSGSPLGNVESGLLQHNVDLVIPNTQYLATIDASAPATPQLIYANISNVYQSQLTDWLNHADQMGLTREAAFFHVAQPTPFAGDSSSSQPVNWFWNVARMEQSGSAATLTPAAHGTADGVVAFGASGTAIVVGYPERFREINLNMSRNGSADWTGQLEYPVAVDANGRPITWKALATLSDSTGGLRTSGQVEFDPPPDWTPAVIAGASAGLYYVRMRTTVGSTANAPIASSIRGRDYVNARGGNSGTIPAFDSSADVNRDGYLNDDEFARRRPGFDARFFYESRLFYPNYGQMRFATNPSDPGVATWAADFTRRLLASNPLADGVFMDNSGGRAPTNGAMLVESTNAYASDFGALLGTINRDIAPHWVLANTAGGGNDADRVVRQVPGTLEEFALRPMAQSWSQFQDLADTITRRLSLSKPSGYLVLDSLSTGGSPTDSRTRMATLAEYYLLADPTATMFMAWGGEEPASSWARHWWDAIAYNVRKPQSAQSEFATGVDPSNRELTYHVYQRHYGNALVLYKPLSYAVGKGGGITGDASATVLQLDGNYRPLNADGTLGPVTRTVTLRNGEGAILVRA